jgi:hypothetical protein
MRLTDDDGPNTPPVWRIVLAFALVPGVAALALASTMPLYSGLGSYFERVWRTAIVFAIVAYPVGIIIGLPTFLVLQRRVAATWLNCALAGAFVAALPWLVIVPLGPSADQASIGGQATVIDGRYTAYGLLSGLQFVGIIAIAGATAGFAFWAVAAANWKRRASIAEDR